MGAERLLLRPQLDGSLLAGDVLLKPRSHGPLEEEPSLARPRQMLSIPSVLPLYIMTDKSASSSSSVDRAYVFGGRDVKVLDSTDDGHRWRYVMPMKQPRWSFAILSHTPSNLPFENDGSLSRSKRSQWESVSMTTVTTRRCETAKDGPLFHLDAFDLEKRRHTCRGGAEHNRCLQDDQTRT